MMCFHHQPSKQTQSTCNNWAKYHKVAAKVSQIAILVVLLGTGREFLFIRKAIAQQPTHPSQATQAKPARMNLAVNRQPEESYESLMSRAQIVAMTAVKQRFSQDRHAPAVSVMIVAHSYGAIAPILSLEVSRNQWQYSKADTKNQMKYFSTARMLLGFDGIASSTTNQPQTPTATPETTPEIEQIEKFIRESDAKSETITEEMPNPEALEAPAIVPVDTPTPELPTVIPGEASVPAPNDTLPTDNVIPSAEAPTVAPNGSSLDPNTTLQQNNVNPSVPTTSPMPANDTLPVNIPNTSDIGPENNQS